MWYVCFIGCLGVVLHKRTELNRRDPLCAACGARRARKKTEKTSPSSSRDGTVSAAAQPPPPRQILFLYNLIIYAIARLAATYQEMKSS